MILNEKSFNEKFNSWQQMYNDSKTKVKILWFLAWDKGQTKDKPLRTKIFLGSLWEIAAYIWTIFFLKINTRNRILLCKSNNQIIKPEA